MVRIAESIHNLSYFTLKFYEHENGLVMNQ